MISKLKLCGVLMALGTFSGTLDAKEEGEWSIDDYLTHLPKKYRTFSGDFAVSTPTADTTITDTKNGYIAYLSGGGDSYPIFEMSLFKPARGKPIVVVSNLKQDPVCAEYETFFLQKQGTKWQDVRAAVLPKLSARMFFRDADVAARFSDASEKASSKQATTGQLSLHFEPPRTGTRMRVVLEICDYVPEELQDEVSFDKALGASRPVWLDWDKQNGVFKQVAFAPDDDRGWTIDDFLKSLPAEYHPFPGVDPTSKSIRWDLDRDTVTFTESVEDPSTSVSADLLRQTNGETLLAVARGQSKPSFFRKRGKTWERVQSGILPALPAEMFYRESALLEKVKAAAADRGLEASSACDLTYSLLPRRGRMNVEVVVHDWMEAVLRNEGDPGSFVLHLNSVRLEWDAEKGLFTLPAKKGNE